jgi:hypothetical protein
VTFPLSASSFPERRRCEDLYVVVVVVVVARRCRLDAEEEEEDDDANLDAKERACALAGATNIVLFVCVYSRVFSTRLCRIWIIDCFFFAMTHDV